MAQKLDPNIELIEKAADYLGRLINEMVFIGGCATGLLVTDPAAPPVRATIDVDMLVEISSFDGRGQNDFLMSRDMEDIVTVLDGRPEIVEEVKRIDKNLRAYLMKRLAGLSENESFTEALPGHLPPDPASQARSDVVLTRIKNILN